MKIWMCRDLMDRATWIALWTHEPRWKEATGWQRVEYGPGFWLSNRKRQASMHPCAGEPLHFALTGEDIPPWPLLSEIEIDVDRFLGSSYSEANLVRIWCPPGYDPPDGWEWE